MRSATTDSRNAENYAHRHNHSLQNTEEEPSRAWNNRSRTRRTLEVPFIAGCSHFTRKNTWFRAPASSPKQSPCNIHAAITIRFAASRSKPASLSAHGTTKWQQIIQPLHKCIVMWRQVSHHSLTPQSHTTVSHHPSLSVLLCDVKSHTTVSHHPSLSALLCDVKSHTTLHWMYSYVMLNLTPPFIECIVMWCQVSHHASLSVLLCDVKSHATLRWVLLCDVKCHTILHWVYCYVM